MVQILGSVIVLLIRKDKAGNGNKMWVRNFC